VISFDFITDEAFRSCLEGDHSELESCLQAKAWKSAHVIAGSIVEAVLIDYLVFSNLKAKEKSDPLKMDLVTAVSTCQKEGAITEKTAHLCSAIKDYRNLIHPGRSIRLGEAVDENSARVAHALVGMVVGEVAKKKKETYGYTAEQLIAKLEADPSAGGILRHLMTGTHEAELGRLLLKVIPRRHGELSGAPDPPSTLLKTLESCFDSAFDMATEQTKQKTATKLVSVIKEEKGEIVFWYENAFFKAEQLKYLSESESHLVKKHILSRARVEETEVLFRLIRSLEEYVTVEETDQFFATVVYFAYVAKGENLNKTARDYIAKPPSKMAYPCKLSGARKIAQTIQLFRERGLNNQAQELQEHKKVWDSALALETLVDAVKQLASPSEQKEKVGG
jgi:hypothetical protein